MNPVQVYMAIAEKFSRKLQLNAIADARDARQIESSPDEASTVQILDRINTRFRELCGIRNELDAATPAAVELLNTLEREASPVTRTTLAAWHYNNRFQEEWFNCRAYLLSVPLTPTLTHGKAEEVYTRIESWFSRLCKANKSHGEVGKAMAKEVNAADWQAYIIEAKKRGANIRETTTVEAYFRRRSTNRKTPQPQKRKRNPE